MNQNVLEEITVRLIKDTTNLEAGLKAAENNARQSAALIEKVWQDRFGKLGQNAGKLVTAASKSADAAVANTVRNLHDQIRTLNAEFARGASNPEKYRAGLQAVAKSLEEVRRSTNLTVSENKQVETALQAASAGYRSFERAAVKAEQQVAAATQKRARETEAAARAAALAASTSSPAGVGGVVNGMSPGAAAGMKAIAQDAQAASDRISRLAMEVRRVNDQFAADRKSPEAYRAAITGLTGSLEAMSRRSGLTRRDLSNIDQALRVATQGTRSMDAATRASAQAQMTLGLRMGTTAENAQSVQASIRELSNLQRGYRSAVDATNESHAQAVERQTRMRDAALRLAAGLREGSDGWRQTMLIAEAAGRNLATLEGRVSRLGLSANVAAAQNRTLSQSLVGLQGIVGIAGIAGVGQLGRQFREMALDSQTARISMQIFNVEVARTGQSVGTGLDVVDRLAERFKVLREDVADNVTQLTRYGASLEQIEQMLTATGASALARGRTAQDGFDAIADAMVGEMSQRLNTIGIAGNLGPTFQQYARSIGKTAEELTNAEKSQAALNMLMRETQGEIEAVETIMNSFIGSNADLVRATIETSRAFGEGLEPVLQSLFNTATGLLQGVSGLPRPLLSAGTAAVTAAAGAASLAGAVGALTWAIRGLGVAAGPIGWIVLGLGAIAGTVAGIVTASQKTNELADSIGELGVSITDLGTFDEITESVKSFASELSGSTRSALDGVISRMERFGTSAVEAARMWQQAEAAIKRLPALEESRDRARQEADSAISAAGLNLPGYNFTVRIDTAGAEQAQKEIQQFGNYYQGQLEELQAIDPDPYGQFADSYLQMAGQMAQANFAADALQPLVEIEAEINSLMAGLDALAQSPLDAPIVDGPAIDGTTQKLRTLKDVLGDYNAALTQAGQRAQFMTAAGMNPMQAQLELLESTARATETAFNAMLTENLAGPQATAELKQQFADVMLALQGQIDDLKFNLDPAAGANRWITRLNNLIERELMTPVAASNALSRRLQELQAQRDSIYDQGIFNSAELDRVLAQISAIESGVQGISSSLPTVPVFPQPDEGQGGGNWRVAHYQELQNILTEVSQAQYELTVRASVLGEEFDWTAERIKILETALMNAARQGIPMTEAELVSLSAELGLLRGVAASSGSAIDRFGQATEGAFSAFQRGVQYLQVGVASYQTLQDGLRNAEAQASVLGQSFDLLSAKVQLHETRVIALIEEYGQEAIAVRVARGELEALRAELDAQIRSREALAALGGLIDVSAGAGLDVAGFTDFISRVQSAAAGSLTLREEMEAMRAESPLLAGALTLAARAAGFDLGAALDSIEAAETAADLAALTDRVQGLVSTATQFDEIRESLIAFAAANEGAADAVARLLQQLDGAELQQVSDSYASLMDSINNLGRDAGDPLASQREALRELARTGLLTTAQVVAAIAAEGEARKRLTAITRAQAAEGAFGAVEVFLGTGSNDFAEMRNALDKLEPFLAAAGIETEKFEQALRVLKDLEMNAYFRELAGTVGGFGGDILSVAADVHQAIAVYRETGDTLGLVTAGFDAATAAVQAFDKAFADGFDGNQFLSGLVGVGSGIASLIGGPAMGEAFAAIGGFVQSILGDLSNGMQQIAATVDQISGSSRYVGRDVVQAFADLNTEQISRGGFLGWLGFTKSSVNQEAVEFLTGLAEGVAGGLAGAFNAADLTEFRNAFNLGIDEMIQQQIIDGFMVTPAVQAALENITLLLAEGNFSGARVEYEKLYESAEDTWETLQKWNREMRNVRGYAQEIQDALRATEDLLAGVATSSLERAFATGAIGIEDYAAALKSLSDSDLTREFQRQVEDLEATRKQALEDGADPAYIRALDEQLKALGIGWREALEQGAFEAAETVKGILGTSIDSLRGVMASALDTVSLDDFWKSWGNGAENATRDGLIRAALDGKVFAAFSDVLTDAVLDGVITADELTDIREAYQEAGEQGAALWEALEELGLGFGDLNETVNSVTASMRNIPSVWRGSLAEWNAGASGFSPASVGARSMSSSSVNSTEIHVHVAGSVLSERDLKTVIVEAQNEHAAGLRVARNGL